jgi:hypothetical protein
MHRPILFATLLFTLAGCGGTPANQAAQAPGQPPAGISVATPDGRAEIRSGAGAAPYPDGLPQYPGATADQSVSVTGSSAQGSGRVLGFRTGDPAAQVIGFYADAASRAGYRIVSRMDAGSSATLMIQRGAGENVSITATRIGDYTQAQIIAAGTAAAQ